MKKTRKNVNNLIGANLTLGVGTMVGSKMDSKYGSPVATPGLSAAAGFMPTVSTATMGMGTLGLVNKSFGKKKKRKRR